MTPLKNIKSQKSDIFWRKILEEYFQVFSFSFPKIFSQIFFGFGKKQLILHGLKKNSPKMENLGRSGP